MTAVATPDDPPPRRRCVLIVPTCATPWHGTAPPRTHIVIATLVAVPTAVPVESSANSQSPASERGSSRRRWAYSGSSRRAGA